MKVLSAPKRPPEPVNWNSSFREGGARSPPPGIKNARKDNVA